MVQIRPCIDRFGQIVFAISASESARWCPEKSCRHPLAALAYNNNNKPVIVVVGVWVYFVC